MENNIKSLLSLISGSSEEFSLEHQLFNTATFISTLYIMISSFESYFIGLSHSKTFTVFLSSFIILSFYYLGRVKKQYTNLIVPIIIFAFITITILWFTNSGVTGTTDMDTIISIALLSVFISGKLKKYTIIAYFILLHTLFAIQYFYPDTITQYSSFNTMIFDKYFTTISSSIILFSLVSFFHSKYTEERIKAENANKMLNEKIYELEKVNSGLQKAMLEVDTLTGLLPICSSCKSIRDDNGYWSQIEIYIQDHSDADFTHGICPTCAKKLYPNIDLYDDEND